MTLDDKTKIKLLKGALSLTLFYQLCFILGANELRAEYKKARAVGNLNYKVAQSFIKHCAHEPAILAAVHSDVEFDWVVRDLDL